MRLFKLLTVFALLATIQFSFAQDNDSADSEENFINKFTKKADQLYRAENYYVAIEEYSKAYSKTNDKAQKAAITYKLAECYYELKDYKRAVRYFDKCARYKYDEEQPEVHLFMGESNKALGKYEDALTSFKTYTEKVPSDKRGANGVKSCQLAIAWKEKPLRYKVTNMAMLNSKYHDVAPAYADRKNKTLIFSSARPAADGKSAESDKTGMSMPDLFTSTLDRKGKWSKPTNEPMAETVNTDGAEGAPTFDSRKSTMYFTRCEVPEREAQGFCYLFAARKMGASGFGEAEKALAIDSANVAHPTLSSDGKTVYFASDLPGGYGGFDIWKATYNRRTKVFENPENLGPQINTSENEMYPYIHADGTLYFSSNGHMGMGGYDIFKIEKDGASFGPVVNMKYPINSEGDDVSIIFEDDMERGYLSSSRPGGKGNLDIYSFVLPKLEFAVQGVVKDAETQAIMKNCTVRLGGSDGNTIEVTTDEAGAYQFTLDPVTNYTLAVKSDEKRKNGKQKYFASDPKMLSTVGVEESKTFQLDFELKQVPVEPIVLPNVLYETGDTSLLPESKIALNQLVNIMRNNPNFEVKIMSHTDFRGSDANNQRLSQGRANSVVAYLVDEKGIEKARLTFEGKGESQPRTITKKTVKDFEKICSEFGINMSDYFKVGDTMSEAFITKLPSKKVQLAAHQFNRRTEFDIVGEDYVSPNKKATGNN